MGERHESKPPFSVSRLERRHVEKTWILLAQRAKAKLLEYQGPNRAPVMRKVFVNAAGTLQERELVSDRYGQASATPVGGARPVARPSESANEHALQTFARELAAEVGQGVHTGECERIVLAAEPHCMGVIKRALEAKCPEQLHACVPKDYFELSDTQLVERLGDELRGG